jgi:taurine dioxygenase
MTTVIDIRPLSDAVGAEVFGLDLRALDETDMTRIRAAFARHGVLCFRDQALSEEDHLAFARRWGEIVVNRFFRPDAAHPEIAEVRKEPHQRQNIGEQWHTDHSYDREPALGSILVARELPPTGGDTEFASMAAAYDALSDGLKETLRGLKAWHSSRHSFGYQSGIDRADNEERLLNPDLATQDALHPIVITHPLSGRKCVYVNPEFTTHIDGWTREESAPLLRYLYDHVTKPEFTTRVVWKPGSVTMWDNRAVQHRAHNDYHGHHRLMHRITIAGTALS